MLSDDVAVTMPPVPPSTTAATPPARFRYRLLEARANGQPACGSYPAIMLTTELFPTSIRAAVAGWLVVAGVLGATSGLWVAGTMADALDSFAGSMVVVCVPGALAAVPFALLPESRGLDLERSAPEESSQLPTAG